MSNNEIDGSGMSKGGACMIDMTQDEFAEIQQLVGPVEREQLIHVDSLLVRM